MKKKLNIAVIGAGRFGSEILRELYKYPKFRTVLLEKNPERVEEIREFADEVYIGDTTSEAFLRKVDLTDIDVFVIGIGDNIQNSILTASIIKEKFKNRQIIAKIVDDRHEEVLRTLGIKDTVNPQKAAARRALMKIINPIFALISYDNIFELSNEISIIRIKPKANWIKKTVSEINLPKSVNIMLILRGNKPIIASGPTTIDANDIIMILGENQEITNLMEN